MKLKHLEWIYDPVDEEEQFLEEVVNVEYLSKDFPFTMADRASIWSWLVIELN